MDRPYKVLLVEDSASDADLIHLQLQRAGLTAHCTRVDDPGSLQAVQRLGPAVERALRETAQAQARRVAEEPLRVLEAAVQAVTEGLVVIAMAAGAQGLEIVFVNDGFLRLTGTSIG